MQKMETIELSYQEWGQGGKKVLLLHGLADNALVWSNLAEYLTPDYHIVAPDLRGHGNSEKPETGYSFPELIADVELLLQKLEWSSVQAIAHSWSAKLLTIWATQKPQYFRSLILVDPFFIDSIPTYFRLSFPILYRVLPFLKTMGPFPSYAVAENTARQLKQYRGWNYWQKQAFQAGMEVKPDGSWGSKFTVSARNQIFEEVMKVSGLTKPVEIPTLLIKPEAGLNRTAWQLKPYRRYLKNLTITKVPGNHWPFLGESDVFNQTVADFLLSIGT